MVRPSIGAILAAIFLLQCVYHAYAQAPSVDCSAYDSLDIRKFLVFRHYQTNEQDLIPEGEEIAYSLRGESRILKGTITRLDPCFVHIDSQPYVYARFQTMKLAKNFRRTSRASRQTPSSRAMPAPANTRTAMAFEAIRLTQATLISVFSTSSPNKPKNLDEWYMGFGFFENEKSNDE